MEPDKHVSLEHFRAVEVWPHRCPTYPNPVVLFLDLHERPRPEDPYSDPTNARETVQVRDDGPNQHQLKAFPYHHSGEFAPRRFHSKW